MHMWIWGEQHGTEKSPTANREVGSQWLSLQYDKQCPKRLTTPYGNLEVVLLTPFCS